MKLELELKEIVHLRSECERLNHANGNLIKEIE
jgi:hypothetical protein